MVKQALHFSSLAPNIIVKIPATRAGIEAIEEATYRGISINATVCFTVSQALAVGAAVEKSLNRRESENKDISKMGPVCTIMVGRLDDWLKVVANKRDIITEPEYLEWAGVAVMKRAYRLFKERRYTTRLLSAATRNHRHWSEFIGGDVVVTLTQQWQKRFNSSDIEVIPRMDNPVDEQIIEALLEKFHDFRMAYTDNGMSINEFDAYGATRRTLRQFLSGYDELTHIIRGLMLPDPDKDK
jgi:transaldolase